MHRLIHLLACGTALLAVAVAGEPVPAFADIRKIDAHSHVFQEMPELEASMRANYAGAGEIAYAGRKVAALNLPRRVLEKHYHRNAERLFQLEKAWAPGAAK